MSNDLKEGLKEVLRTGVLAAIPLVISQLQSGAVDVKAVGIAVAIAVLSGLDKYLHKADKGLGGNGLTGF